MKKIPDVPFVKANKVEIEFEILKLSSLFSRYNYPNSPLIRPHRPNFYHILYNTRGAGVHHIDFHAFSFKEKSLLFISKGQVQAFEVARDRDGFMIIFTEAFLTKDLVHSDILSLSSLYNYHLYAPVIEPDEDTEQNFGSIIQDMYQEYNNSTSLGKEEMLRLLLKLLLLKAERKRQAIAPQQGNSAWVLRFSEFRNLLETHIIETRNANDYADMMHISYKHLNEICKSISGKTAKEFIDNYVVLEIKRQLATSDHSVKELAYDLGFDEPTNFVKYFKKHTDSSPAQFKKMLTK